MTAAFFDAADDSGLRRRTAPLSVLSVAALVVLVYSSFFKGSPLLAGFPIDLTLAGVGMTGLGCLAALLTAPGHYRAALSTLGLAAVFLFGVWDAVPDYGTSKVAQFYLVTFIGILGVCVLLNTTHRRRMWAIAQIGIGALLAISALLSPRAQEYNASGAAALLIEGSNTIATGRAAGVAVVGLLVLASTGRGARRLLYATLGLAAVYPLLNSGSRGPVAAAVIAVVGVALFAPSQVRSRATRVVLVAIAASAGYYLLRGDTSGGAGRVTSTLLAGNLTDDSSSARFTLWNDALSYIAVHPLGGGWGTFSLPHNFSLLGTQGFRYPHNLLLEITGEAGWVAGGAFILYWAGALRRLRRSSNDPFTAVLFGIAIFSLVNALVSSDLSDRLAWASVAAGWAVPLVPRAAPIVSIPRSLPKRRSTAPGRGPLVPRVDVCASRSPDLPPEWRRVLGETNDREPSSYW